MHKYYPLWSLSQFLISVIPACPESFRKDSRRALLAGMTPKKIFDQIDGPAALPEGVFKDFEDIHVPAYKDQLHLLG